MNVPLAGSFVRGVPFMLRYVLTFAETEMGVYKMMRVTARGALANSPNFHAAMLPNSIIQP